uniref:Uncharacterized protein n=1 Tax=Oryza nivara TaxID=4536 RepID=A0A0E0FS68_ORYNI
MDGSYRHGEHPGYTISLRFVQSSGLLQKSPAGDRLIERGGDPATREKLFEEARTHLELPLALSSRFIRSSRGYYI